MSYENEMRKKMSENIQTNDNLEISTLKYLWDAGPLSFLTKESYHDFFKKTSVLTSFTDNEIRLFTKFLHRREFLPDEVVFNQGDSGYGFYFIFSGAVNVYRNYKVSNAGPGDFVVRLEKRQYFGEMGLLENLNRRTATVVSADKTVLLGVFKPDLDRMLENYPVIGAKFLRETALIMANRMGQLTREVASLKKKIIELEHKL